MLESRGIPRHIINLDINWCALSVSYLGHSPSRKRPSTLTNTCWI